MANNIRDERGSGASVIFLKPNDADFNNRDFSLINIHTERRSLHRGWSHNSAKHQISNLA